MIEKICLTCRNYMGQGRCSIKPSYDNLMRVNGTCEHYEPPRTVAFGVGSDSVEHPGHYTGEVECIDAMVQTQGRGAVRDFCVCNAFKYLWRWRHKGGAEDVRKAKWYLEKFLELTDGGSDD